MATLRGADANWRPTLALGAALAAAVLAVALAVPTRHPDLLVIAAPFAVSVALLPVRRPSSAPNPVQVDLPGDVVSEGDEIPVRLITDDAVGVDLVRVALEHSPGLEVREPGTSVAVRPGADLVATMRALRWGRGRVGGVTSVEIAGHGLLARLGPVVAARDLSVLPVRGVFEAADAVPHVEGLVGVHRSRATGPGVDVQGVRAFAPGDRLRRITWPVSLRTGRLHVTTSTEDRDAEVQLIVDSSVDVGPADPAAASSLDIAVRGAAAVADHYLRQGDRVRLIDLASTRPPVRLSGGRRQLLRLLIPLLASAADGIADELPGDRRLANVPPQALGIVFSALLDERAHAQLATLAMHGQTMLVIDTLPDAAQPAFPNEVRLLAWRLALLRRDEVRQRLAVLGVPVVRWAGAGSLDDVLQAVSRAALVPRRRR